MNMGRFVPPSSIGRSRSRPHRDIKPQHTTPAYTLRGRSDGSRSPIDSSPWLDLFQNCFFTDLGSLDGDLQSAEYLMPLICRHRIEGCWQSPASSWPGTSRKQPNILGRQGLWPPADQGVLDRRFLPEREEPHRQRLHQSEGE
jgi:hypothetical protein